MGVQVVGIKSLLHLSPFQATLSYWLGPLESPVCLYRVFFPGYMFLFSLKLIFLNLGPLTSFNILYFQCLTTLFIYLAK